MNAPLPAEKSRAPLSAEIDLPLVVELDRTLVRTTIWQEHFARILFLEPLAAVACLGSLLRGRAAFNEHLFLHDVPGVAGLPYREPLVELLHTERARGRQIHLVASSDGRTATAVATHLGLFDRVIGADRPAPADAPEFEDLRKLFPDGIIYAGAGGRFSAAAIRGVILSDHEGPDTARDAPVLADLREPKSAVTAWLRALRLHQWSKNTLIFIPLFVGHAYGSAANVLHAVAGFALICVLASATYILNDLADLRDDRLHHTKRSRPFARGDLSVASGLVIAPVLILGSLFCAYALEPSFAASLLLYLLLTLSYSFGLKRLPLLDVFVISSLFGLRIVMGTAVIGFGYSPWLLSFSWAFFLSLALAKRHVEVMRAAKIDDEDVVGRGYVGSDWPVTLSFGVGAGMTSIVIMLLYLTNDAAPSGFYHDPRWLYFVPVFMTMWLMRIWLLSNRMQLDDDPVVFALRDRTSLALGLLTAVVFFLAL